MHIYFQSGEFLTQDSRETFFNWLNFLGTILGVISGAAIALFVFYKAERIKEKAERQRLKDVEEYLFGFIRDLATPIEKQAEFFWHPSKQ